MSTYEDDEDDPSASQQAGAQEASEVTMHRELLGPLVELAKELAPLSEIDKATDVKPAVASSVLSRVSTLVQNVGNVAGAGDASRVAKEVSDLTWDVHFTEGVPRNALMTVGAAALRVGLAAVVAGGIAGPYIAMALHDDMVEKVVETAIGGAFGQFAGELGSFRSSQQQERQIAELKASVSGLSAAILARSDSSPGPSVLDKLDEQDDGPPSRERGREGPNREAPNREESNPDEPGPGLGL